MGLGLFVISFALAGGNENSLFLILLKVKLVGFKIRGPRCCYETRRTSVLCPVRKGSRILVADLQGAIAIMQLYCNVHFDLLS